jgi:hypothetical protein
MHGVHRGLLRIGGAAMMSECDCEWQTVIPSSEDEPVTTIWHHLCSRVAGHRDAHICLCGDTWPPLTEGQAWLGSLLSQFRLVTDDTLDFPDDDSAH